jgi:hypothetical protein
MTKYEKKLNEIGKSRNTARFASKIRGVKWNDNQISSMRKIASLEKSPDLASVKKLYPNMGEYKLIKTLEKIKEFRKEMADVIGYEIPIEGIHNPDKKGIIYLVENELYDGWIKCGMTVNMKSRIGSYNCNDPLKRFRLIIEKNVDDRRKSESLLKYNLKMISSMNSGEWYKISKEDAVKIFSTIN